MTQNITLEHYTRQANPATKPPKIVIIGAGSAIFGLGALSTMLQSPLLRGAHLALCDINEAGLEMMTQLANMMNESWGADMTVSSSTNRRDLLAGADFVIVSVQVGPREEVWEMDWQIPLRHGVRQPYAENGGPGAFSHAARNMPLIIDIARDMEELCPNAYYLNLVNPMIRLTTGVQRFTDVKVVGLCHQLLWGYTMAATVLADELDIEIPDPQHFHVHTDAENMPPFIKVAQQAIAKLDIKAAGINHFSWVYDLRHKETGEDLYPLLKKTWLGGFRKDFEPLSREMLEIYGMMPTAGDSHMCEYLTFVSDPVAKPWEKYDLKLQSWDGNRKRRASRWRLVSDIVEGAIPVDNLRDTWRHDILDEGIPDMIAAVHYNRQHYHPQLNIPNQGYIPNLPNGAIVEVPGVISSFGFQGLGFPELPPGIAELCRRELALSEMVVEASVTGDRQLALQALLHDPMVTDIDQARAILDDLLTEFGQYLPQFA